MAIIRLLVFLSGAGLVFITFMSATRTFVLTRSSPVLLTNLIFKWMRKIFNGIVKIAPSYQQRDSIMAMYAPLCLLLMVPTWLLMTTFGYMLMFWALGMTPLWDATLESIDTVESYAQTLSDQDYFCNGLVVVITDGCENSSSRVTRMSQITDAMAKIRKNESLESIKTILIGVNDADLMDELTEFKNEAGFDEYISISDANPSSLAKMANFISQSISSTSQSLGSGGPSKAVNFSL